MNDCAAMVAPQGGGSRRSRRLLPVTMARLEMLRVSKPELVRVAVRGALVAPTLVLGKAREWEWWGESERPNFCYEGIAVSAERASGRRRE